MANANIFDRSGGMSMRSVRGVTPIISVILLLMMTVAVAGLAWFWLQSLTSTTMSASENMTTTQMKQMLTIIDLADYTMRCNSSGNNAVDNITFQVFNKGSNDVTISSVTLNGKTASLLPNVAVSVNTGSIKEVTVANVISTATMTGSKGVDVMLFSNQGYVKKTLTLDGPAKCNQ